MQRQNRKPDRRYKGMRNFFKRAKDTMLRQEGGFTLIELLVVIGIIVALAAITIPLVIRFTGSGKEGALAAERETVQTAMNAMMAEQNITTVNDHSSGGGHNTWTAEPTSAGSAPLSGYMQKNTTTYYYCWEANGAVYAQNAAANTTGTATTAETAGTCFAPAP